MAAGDEGAVRAVVAAYVDARERRDPAAIGALFTADADQVNSAGDWRRGREGIVKGTLESSQRNTGARRITIKAVRFPSANVAVADGDYEIGDETDVDDVRDDPAGRGLEDYGDPQRAAHFDITSRIATAVTGELTMFMPRCTPSAIRSGVQPRLFGVFHTSMRAPFSAR